MSDNVFIITVIILLVILLVGIIIVTLYNDKKNKSIRNVVPNVNNTNPNDGLFQDRKESRDSDGRNLNYHKQLNNTQTPINRSTQTIAQQSSLSNHKNESNISNQSNNKYARLGGKVTEGPTIESLRDLAGNSSSGLDSNCDYMTYITLANFTELKQVPRFTNGLFNVLFLGYRKDTRGLEQVRALPSVEYSGFIIALQALSRTVTAEPQQLQEFTHNVRKYLDLIGTDYKFECDDINQFMSKLNTFKEVRDELDKVISVYFQAPNGVSPMVFSAKMKSIGFKLDVSGIFDYIDNNDNRICYACTTNSTPFRTDNSVNNGDGYNQFQLIFDIPLVKDGENSFQLYIDCCTKICKQLDGFKMVNEQGEDISEALLSEVKDYVADIQDKMKDKKIIPGSNLAKRLFLN